MSDGELEQRGRLVRLMTQLRSAKPGVGRRLEARHLALRMQNFGGGRVGLRILLKARPRVGVTVELVDSQVRHAQGGWALDIVERTPGASEQSVALFSDLVVRLSEASAAAASAQVESALRAWKAAFSRRSDLLEKNEILGLFGELTILGEMLADGVDSQTAITAWTGPSKADHDFTFSGQFQVEVKATSPQSERLKITNEHQLEGKDVPLYLACVRAALVEERETATTLTRLVQELTTRIEDEGARRIFHQILESLNFDRFDERYEDIHLERSSITLYLVQEGMPRITPSQLQTGVTQVSYQIFTSDLGPYQVEVRPWNREDRSAE